MATLNKPGKVILEANDLSKLLSLVINAVYPTKNAIEVRDITVFCENIANNIEYLEDKIREENIDEA